MSRVLIVGATRGLGANLVKHYASSSSNSVWGTTRADWTPKHFPKTVEWACRVDLMKPEVGKILTSQLDSRPLDLVVGLLTFGRATYLLMSLRSSPLDISPSKTLRLVPTGMRSSVCTQHPPSPRSP